MKKWFTKDWGLKLMALFLAIGLWYYAVGEEGIEVTRTIPLEIKVENPQMSILKTSVTSVEITMQAPRALLPELTSKEIFASHKIGNEVQTAGDYSFRLEPREIKVPNPQVRVVNIEPEIIGVTLDEQIVQKLPVQLNFVGEPAMGYQVIKDEIELNPNAILVEGPKRYLEKIDLAMSEELLLVGRTRPYRRTVRLNLPGNVKPLSEALIDAYIPIRQEFDERSFEDIPVRILKKAQINEKIALNPSTVSFVVKGPKLQLTELDEEKVLPYVDVTELDSGEHQALVSFVLPEDVSLKEGSEVLVTVSIKK